VGKAPTARRRFLDVMRGERPEDRLPVFEWASWWDKTLARWRGEGLPEGLAGAELKRHFGIDVDRQHWFWGFDGQAKPVRDEPRVWMETAEQYEGLRPHLYNVWSDEEKWSTWATEQASGESVVWMTLNGFFWWPRVLLGVEAHLYSFYDTPELLHRINQDQAEYCLGCIERICRVLTPDFMTFAEDMSYNNGPMISREQFEEFLLPYYNRVIPALRERGITVFVDSDGDVTRMVPWLIEAGIDGVLPLERQAGVDVLRREHPGFLLAGGFDKLTMSRGKDAMREEFERLLPAMRAGRYLPSCDHQTPPEVSLENYRVYLGLLREYATKAAG
jgi:hypothetical protein